MGSTLKRTPADWFEVAALGHVENHQGCASCGRSHSVFLSRWGQRVEYYCSGCDFSTCHDPESNRYFASEGDGRQLEDSLFAPLALCVDNKFDRSTPSHSLRNCIHFLP